jgi:hypothetical protein
MHFVNNSSKVQKIMSQKTTTLIALWSVTCG